MRWQKVLLTHVFVLACLLAFLIFLRLIPDSERDTDHVLPLLPDPNCPAPCWNGVQVGVTSYAEAQTLIEALPQVSPVVVVRWMFSPDGEYQHQAQFFLLQENVVTAISFTPEGVMFGDIIANWRTPDYERVEEQIRLGTSPQNCVIAQQVFTFYYEAEALTVEVTVPAGSRLSPYSKVTEVAYSSRLRLQTNWSPWRGFHHQRLSNWSVLCPPTPIPFT